MKATDKQYKKAEKIYENGGDVYDYANKIGIDEWSICKACDAETPDCEDDACLVCGTFRKQL